MKIFTKFKQNNLTITVCVKLVYCKRFMQKTSETIYKISRPIFRKTFSRGVHYHVDNMDAYKSTHELSQKNPILKKMLKKGPIDNNYQHPNIGRITCQQPACENKICDKICGKDVEKVYVGHITHSNYPGSKFLSGKDFNGNNREQYGVFYNPVTHNKDTQGKNINEQKTQELNNNKETQTMIHIYSSRNPLQDENII